MKHNKNHDHAKSPGSQLEPVCFDFTHPTATTVCVAGTFNDWQPETKPLHSAGGGRWHKDTVLPPGTYEYCLVVDGHWIPDPLAKETAPNPFGGRNSLLTVAKSREATHLADAEHLPLKNANVNENTNIMSKQTKAFSNDLGQLADDARALMVATADVAGEKIEEARKRLAATLDSGSTILGRVRTKAYEGAKATDEALHEHPYSAIGIAFGVGATLIGFLAARRCSRNGD